MQMGYEYSISCARMSTLAKALVALMAMAAVAELAAAAAAAAANENTIQWSVGEYYSGWSATTRSRML